MRGPSGNPVTFSGVTVESVLRQAGVGFGPQLRGSSLPTFLVVESSDGFRAVFSLPELDTTFSDKIVLPANTKDDEPLPFSEGPWRIVIPDERNQVLWVRHVRTLRIMRAEGNCVAGNRR
jgi:hypothetical protein